MSDSEEEDKAYPLHPGESVKPREHSPVFGKGLVPKKRGARGVCLAHVHSSTIQTGGSIVGITSVKEFEMELADIILTSG